MALTPGTRLGVYEITAQIGEGGMGQVYRATDIKLKRQVAIKILPPSLAADADRLARFQREAEVLASLNHPHIAGIYGLEEGGGALVMELVEGDDLSQRIARGAMPLDEALPIAKQIAEALEAAHEQGIIHRDLKPANIKVRMDGTVKVLDFGLAKAMEPPASSSPSMSMSPTITTPAMTQAGLILGTAAYMSPEQAKGRQADRRSDIWAFGVVLYEMLTGRRAFDGEDMVEVLGAVVRLEPHWEALPADVPLPVRTLLHGCLVKDRGRRVADISTALFVLDNAASLAAPVVLESLSRPPLWRRIVTAVAVALVAATIAGTGVWYATRAAAPLPSRASRLLIGTTGTAALSISGNSVLAIAPDGSRVVYVGNNGTQLFVRALDALEPAVVFTSIEASLNGPFVSPDSRWIGFIEGNALKKVAVTGGPATPLASLDGTARGATWGADDTIIAATTNTATGLQRVAAAGGPTAVLTRPDPANGEADHVWPERLPGGRAVLFTITSVSGGLDSAQVAVLDLQTGTRTVLVRGGSFGRYMPSGHLVFAAAGELRAVPFDLARLETRGTPVTVVRNVLTAALGVVHTVVSDDGTLAYVSGNPAAASVAARTLVWVDRQGRETPIPAPPRRYVYPRLSPDGTRVAIVAIDQEVDVWVLDLGPAGGLARATFDAGIDHSPVWTPDGLRLIFSSERVGMRNLFWRAANTTGAVERLAESASWQHASDVSGRHLIFTERSPATAEDIMQLELDGTHRVTPVVQSPFNERNGVVSPNGRWLAYETNESGRFEISVRPFPDVNSGYRQVSAAGGTRPLWTRNGQELIYVSPTGGLMSVGVARGTSWAATRPVPVVKEGYVTMPVVDAGRTYDVGPDGRFLMVKTGGTDQTAAPAALVVVQHWAEELKRLVPTK